MIHNRFDMSDIAEELGGHFNKHDMLTYTAQCTVCGNKVKQTENFCAECSTPVVWFGSKTWRNSFGSPQARERELLGETPTTATGLLLCRRAGVPSFPSAHEEQIWARAENALGSTVMEGVVRYVIDSKHRIGHGAISHAINLAKKKHAEYKTKTKETPRDEPAPATTMW
jgi:hypothetical protein